MHEKTTCVTPPTSTPNGGACSTRTFNNDTTPRDDTKAAAEAWTRTPALFNRSLR